MKGLRVKKYEVSNLESIKYCDINVAGKKRDKYNKGVMSSSTSIAYFYNWKLKKNNHSPLFSNLPAGINHKELKIYYILAFVIISSSLNSRIVKMLKSWKVKNLRP
jgi:hypothetical protein